jgi:hypothetical protein
MTLCNNDNNSNNNIVIYDDVVVEIAMFATVDTMLAIAATNRRLRAKILSIYNKIPVVKLSSIHELFSNIIPENVVVYRCERQNNILMTPKSAQCQLQRLHEEDYGIWCIVKDQLQYNRNHQLVKINFNTNVVSTVLRCGWCCKLSSCVMFCPFLTDSIVNMIMLCLGCMSRYEADYKSLLIEYIKTHKITNQHIVHHHHANVGHCVYRRRYHNDSEFSILNDSEVFAKIITDHHNGDIITHITKI